MGNKFSRRAKSRSQQPAKCSGLQQAPCTIMDQCGLVTQNGKQVPLKSVEMEVQVKGHVAIVTSVLKYVNEEKENPLEAVFVFPLPSEAAICHFSAKIGDQEVVAEVQEKEKAREQYDDAVSSGQQAFLLEESDESPDVFRLCVGSLPPKEVTSVTLIYIIELELQADNGLRFCLPAVLNPRYSPRGVQTGIASEITAVPADLVPYTLSLDVRVSSPNPVSKVESNCSLEPLNYLNPTRTESKVSLSLGHKFDRDVELLIYYQDVHQPTAIVEGGRTDAKSGSLMGDAVVMLTLYPEFPPEVASSFGKHVEFIFLMDQSGSMSGSSIQSARETLLLLMKSLPMGCFFNIYGFGSRFHSFFQQSVEYTQNTMNEALTKVKAMEANMGGTEILDPLKNIYKQALIPDHPRQLFVFTDGAVGNTKEILDLVRSHAKSHRCYTFGIGHGASTALITGMAKEGSGHAQFITGDDRLQLKVMQSLSFALQPAVRNISVEWTLPGGVSVTTLSPPLNVLHQGQRALLYAQLKGEITGNNEGTVSVRYNLAEQLVTNQLNFCLKPAEDTGLAVHRLGARTLMRSVEMEEREKKDTKLREKVVELSVEAGVISSFTAFIAVYKGSGKQVKGPLLRKMVPVAKERCSFGVRRRSAHETPPGQLDKRQAPRRALPSMNHLLDPAGFPDYGSVFPGNHDFGDSDDEIYSPYESEDGEWINQAEMSNEPNSQQNPYMQLISLQTAEGFWTMEAGLFNVLGKTEEEVTKQMPGQVDKSAWATVLALIWLHGFRASSKEEWQILAMKAASWIQSQKVKNLSQCVQAGNALLGCQVSEQLNMSVIDI